MRKLFLLFLLFCFGSSESQTIQSFLTVETRVELRNYSSIPNNRVIAAIGLNSAWDQPTEIWTFDAASTATDNGTTVLKPNDIPFGSPGRYLFRTYFVKQYGTLYSKEWNGSIATSGTTARLIILLLDSLL